jgi:hypothetical protein
MDPVSDLVPDPVPVPDLVTDPFLDMVPDPVPDMVINPVPDMVSDPDLFPGDRALQMPGSVIFMNSASEIFFFRKPTCHVVLKLFHAT